jgi:hypothetical protein
MLGLLAPGWLLGLTALTIPLALHMWSRRGGRPIRVGSIRLLLGAPPATRRSWAVQDPVLLLVRSAVLAVLVLALAAPYWAPETGSGSRWALVADDVAGRNALVDSLTRAGLVVYPVDSTPAPLDRPQNLWAVMRDADRAAPPHTRFELFAPQRLRYFRGQRPLIGAPVEWHARDAAGGSPAGSPVSSSARLVTIFVDASRTDDARYLQAAMQAAGQATGIQALVRMGAAGGLGLTDGPEDWIVWLSPRPVPTTVLERVRGGATLLTDAGSASPNDHRSRILLMDRPSDAWLARRSDEADSGAPLWSDGSGNPLLTVTREGRGLHYRFHGRFHPAWSELVLRPTFPEALARIWVGGDPAVARSDDRLIALSQLFPAHDSAAVSSTAGPPMRGRSLFLPVWLLALALFGVERWLTARPRRQPT